MPRNFSPVLYPGLNQLLEGNDAVQRRLRIFGTSSLRKSQRERLLRILKSFDKSLKATTPSEMVTERPSQEWTSDAYCGGQSQFQDLYRTLSAYCLCRKGDDPTPMTINLRFKKSCEPDSVSSSVSFRAFILDHPHQGCSSRLSQWQDAHICILRKK